MSVLFAILIFSLLIFVHELGHFTAAKLSGVQVNEFSIFMGPALWKKQVGETLYAIRLIPIGGYCAMEGEDEQSDNPRAFTRAAWWKKLIILVAGAAMNFLVGVLMMVIVYLPTSALVEPVISQFEPYNTISGEDGLQVGDRILELDGEKIYVHTDFSVLLSLSDRQTHELVVERNGEKIYFEEFPLESHEIPQEDGTTKKLLGMSFTLVDAPGLGQKVGYALRMSRDTVRLVRLSLQMLLTGQAGLRDMTGPVGLVAQMSQVAEDSASAWDALLNMLYLGGFIAINLGVMNLLPIPALDGGRAVGVLITAAVEGITKKKINPRYEGYLHGAGMIALLILMAVIMFKDVFVLITG